MAEFISPAAPTSGSKWADAPFRLISESHCSTLLPASVPKDHACIYWARQMSVIHNTIIRALNASYNQCLAVRPGTQEASDFLLFNKTLFVFLDRHHKVEEEFMFPQIEALLGQPGAMEMNVQQHQAFQEGLNIFGEYVKNTKAEEYDGVTLRHIIDVFGRTLTQHMHEEIPTLLSLHVLDSAELMRIWKRAEHEATKDGDMYVELPFMLSCQDHEFRLDGEVRDFPTVPFFVVWLVSVWFQRRNGGCWRFSPSDMTRRRKDLAFAS